MKFNKVSLLFPIFYLIITVHTYSQPTKELIKKEILQTLATEISGVKAKEFVAEISLYHRINGAYENTGYEKAVVYVMSILKSDDVEGLELLTYLSDGETHYGTWRCNPGFRVRNAKLSLIQPSQQKMLCLPIMQNISSRKK